MFLKSLLFLADLHRNGFVYDSYEDELLMNLSTRTSSMVFQERSLIELILRTYLRSK